MPLYTLNDLLDIASQYDFAVPAINVNYIEQAQSLLNCARENESPIILQFTKPAREFIGDGLIRSFIQSLPHEFPDVPICIHQDHAFEIETCRTAIELGFTSVMMDGTLEADGETLTDSNYNTSITRQAIDMAKLKGVSVEGSIGIVGSVMSCVSNFEDDYRPNISSIAGTQKVTALEAKYFVEKTNASVLSVALGTTHGYNKNPSDSIIDIELLKSIRKAIPETHLVLHGASSVHEDVLNELNQLGLNLEKASGVPENLVSEAIDQGIRKINLDTDFRLAFSLGVRRAIKSTGNIIDPKVILNAGCMEIEAICAQKMKLCKSSGRNKLYI